MLLIGSIRTQTRCRLQSLAAVTLLTATSALAEPLEAAVSAGDVEAATVSQPLDYSEKSDVELTRLGARWDELSKPERDALLREVKLRMAQRKDADGVLMIRTQRRYGRIYRSDGRYLKIETKVVQVRPADPDAIANGVDGPREFGVGFEKRTARADQPAEQAEQPPQELHSDATVETPSVRRVNGSLQ